VSDTVSDVSDLLTSTNEFYRQTRSEWLVVSMAQTHILNTESKVKY